MAERSLMIYGRNLQDVRRMRRQQPNFVFLHEESRILHKVNYNTKQWSRMVRTPSLPNASNSRPQIVSINNILYLLHGKFLSKLVETKWKNLAPMSYEISSVRCVAFQGSLYAIGSDWAWKYDVEKDLWTELQGCGLGRGFAVTSSNSHIYALGGEGTTKRAMEFEPGANKWEPIKSMKCDRIGCAGAWFDGKLYAFGGVLRLPNSESYMPSNDMWTILKHLLVPKYDIKALNINSEIYIAGETRVVKKIYKDEQVKIEVIDLGGECSPIACILYD